MIFLDTETTGLLEPEINDLNLQPYITELYMVQLTWEGGQFTFEKEYEQLFNIPIPLPEFITKITNITPAMLMDQPTFASEYLNIAHFFLGEKIVVGHNLSFDLGMIWTELARIEKEIQFPWPIEHHCTVELSLGIEHHRLKLSKLHELATGKPHEGAHRARGDVEAMVRCYEWMLKEGHIL